MNSGDLEEKNPHSKGQIGKLSWQIWSSFKMFPACCFVVVVFSKCAYLWFVVAIYTGNDYITVMEKLKHLYYAGSLTVGSYIEPPKELSKRLSRVLRLKQGDKIALFNGADGLFEVELKDDKASILSVLSIIKPQVMLPKVTLLIGMVKKDAMDRIFRQATEYGVTHIQPLLTEFTVVDKLNGDRIKTLLVEAAEQCERMSVPKLRDPAPLNEVIKQYEGTVFWCAEQVAGKWGDEPSKAGDAILVGPEGGFSQAERTWLRECINVTAVGLGTHILRADTAVVAGLSRFYERLV